MRKLNKFRILQVVVAIALVAILTNTVLIQAQTVDPNKIYACIGNSASSTKLKLGGRDIPPDTLVRIIAPTGSCNANETAINWNIQGPKGDTGATGPQGPQGPSGNATLYGDGSAGPLTVSGPADWTTNAGFPITGANLQFTTLTINSLASLTVPSGTVIKATGNVVINGTLSVAPGAVGSAGYTTHPGSAARPAAIYYAGLGIGKMQAANLKHPPMGGGAGAAFGTGDGSSGGSGGGSLVIIAGGSITIGNTGAISANGTNGVNPQTVGTGITGPGGGGGGIIILASKGALTSSGNISAIGGNGANGWDGNGGDGEGGGGGGGGGIVHLLSPTSPTITGAISVSGGSAGSNAGASPNVSPGGGGGGAGGNGGNGGGQVTFGSTVQSAQSGSTGYVITTVIAEPANLLS